LYGLYFNINIIMTGFKRGTLVLLLCLPFLLTAWCRVLIEQLTWFAACQEIPRILRNLKVHYCTHKRPPPVSILGHSNPVRISTSHLLQIRPNIIHSKGKAVPLQAWSGPEGSRKLKFPDFMTRAQDGGKVVSLTHRPPLPPGNVPGSHFCYRLSRLQGRSAIGRIFMSIKSSNDTSWNRTSDLPTCSTAP